jgi:hypothetical protein
MAALAASLPLKALNRVGFRLYEKFVPDVLKGAEGVGCQGSLAPGAFAAHASVAPNRRAIDQAEAADAAAGVRR